MEHGRKITNLTPNSGKKAVELTWREQEVIRILRAARRFDVVTIAVNQSGRVWSVNHERNERTILEALQLGGESTASYRPREDEVV